MNREEIAKHFWIGSKLPKRGEWCWEKVNNLNAKFKDRFYKLADFHIAELEKAKREARVEGLRFVLDNMYSVQNISKIKEEVSSQYITGQIKCMAEINKFIENEIINNKE